MDGETLGQTRVCSKCGEEKPATPAFYNRKLNGLTARCKPCLAAEKRAAWAATAVEVNARRRAARALDPEAVRRRDRERYAANPAPKMASARNYRLRAPERVKESHRAYYERNRAARVAAAIEYAERNADRRRANMRHYCARKRKEDPRYRVKSAVSAYMNFCLRKGKAGRKWQTLVGYTLDELTTHLERQFAKGMNWQNYGRDGWQIDHILPVSSFCFSSADDPEFRACWALTNLRPLWAAENRSKSDQRTHLL